MNEVTVVKVRHRPIARLPPSAFEAIYRRTTLGLEARSVATHGTDCRTNLLRVEYGRRQYTRRSQGWYRVLEPRQQPARGWYRTEQGTSIYYLPVEVCATEKIYVQMKDSYSFDMAFRKNCRPPQSRKCPRRVKGVRLPQEGRRAGSPDALVKAVLILTRFTSISRWARVGNQAEGIFQDGTELRGQQGPE